MPYGIVRARNAEGKLAALRCKRWGCTDCGPLLKHRLRRGIGHAVEVRPTLTRFVTLTLPGEARDLPLKDRWRLLTTAWDKASKRLERQTGQRLGYLAVREPHKDGTPHLHMLVERFLPRQHLRALWMEVGGGSQVNIKAVDPQRAAAYMSKYLAKDGNPPPRGLRKYSSGGGVKVEGIRPKGDGSYWVETKCQDGRWWWVADPRPLFGWLAAMERQKSGPPEALVQAFTRSWARRNIRTHQAQIG